MHIFYPEKKKLYPEIFRIRHTIGIYAKNIQNFAYFLYQPLYDQIIILTFVKTLKQNTMDLLIKEIKKGTHSSEYKVTAYNNKGRFVVDHFNPHDPFGSFSKPKIAILQKYQLVLMYRLIKLAGELNCWETPGFKYELVEEETEFR